MILGQRKPANLWLSKIRFGCRELDEIASEKVVTWMIAVDFSAASSQIDRKNGTQYLAYSGAKQPESQLSTDSMRAVPSRAIRWKAGFSLGRLRESVAIYRMRRIYELRAKKPAREHSQAGLSRFQRLRQLHTFNSSRVVVQSRLPILPA